MSKGQSLIKLKDILGDYVSNFIVVDSISDFLIKKKLLRKNKKYAIRSSANCEDGDTYSFAGIFNTYLNIDFKEIEPKLRDIFNLKLCPNLETYLQHFKLNEVDIRLEVVIQEMIDCSTAGVCFSVNPTNQYDEYVIEAVWGLGDGLVSGKYAPDQIIVKKDGNIQYTVKHQKFKTICLNSGINDIIVSCIDQSRKKLNTKQINQIIFLMEKLKKHYLKPFEIEWGFQQNTLYIFQIRPITTIVS